MKITKYLLSMAAALGMIAGCYKPELIQVSTPEDVVAPVLEDLAGPIEITAENMAGGEVVFNWSLADYGVKTQVDYSIEVATVASPDALVVVASGLNADTTALNTNLMTHKVDYESLNQILFNDLQLSDGVATEILFSVGAKVGEYPKIYSNTVKVSAKITAAEKVYPMIYMPGSYQGWDPAGAATKFQVLYDFAGNGVYEGIADFGQANDEGRAWKFTREPNWDFDWGIPEGETPAAEAAEVTLHNNDNGGRSDIKIYTVNRYYHFSMDTNTGLLKNNFSFDQIGVIGSFNNWGGDVVMEFNAAKKRFYADVEFAEDGQFKLRADADWAMNWGADAFGVTVSNGDGNLEAKAGKYRVYAYMSNPAEMTLELVAGMYGQEETAGGSTTPEPEPEPETPAAKGWGLVGEFNSWGGSADLVLTSDGTYFVAKGVSIEGQFKFRKDADWAVNLGATGDVEPFELTANVETELAAGGKNMTLPAGKYDIYLDETNSKAWFINDGSYPGGGVAPSTDVTLYFVPDAAWTEGGVTFAAWIWATGGEGSWYEMTDVNSDGVYEVTFPKELDNIIFASMNGANDWSNKVKQTADLKVPTDGKNAFDAATNAWFVLGGDAPVAPEEPETPAEQAWYLVGSFNNWTVADATYQLTSKAGWYVLKGFTLAEAAEVKFNAGGWDVNRGGAFAAVDEAIAVEQNGANIAVPAGTYDVYLSADASVAYFMTPGQVPAASETPETPAEPETSVENTWYLVGSFNSWTVADAAYKMTFEAGWHVFKGFTLAEAAEVKFNAGGWDVNRGGAFAAVDEAIAVEQNGANIAVPAGTYDVYLSKAEDTAYFMTPGATPAK